MELTEQEKKLLTVFFVKGIDYLKDENGSVSEEDRAIIKSLRAKLLNVF